MPRKSGPNTNPLTGYPYTVDLKTGEGVNVDPLAEQVQTHLTTKQTRVVEIALDHLDDLPHERAMWEDESGIHRNLDAVDLRTPVEYTANVLLYMGRVAKADVNMLTGALKTHLRQSGVLTAAERAELLDVAED